jgi:hypothetical protein
MPAGKSTYMSQADERSSSHACTSIAILEWKCYLVGEVSVDLEDEAHP